MGHSSREYQCIASVKSKGKGQRRIKMRVWWYRILETRNVLRNKRSRVLNAAFVSDVGRKGEH